MSTTPHAALPQEIAGRYLVESRLGAGAFGTVYKARDKLLGRRVAIKTIRLDGLVATQTALEELVERFQREARVSAQLRHPGIVTIFDVGHAEGAHYLAMEFIDGAPLDHLIAGERRLPAGRAAAICAQVAEALHYAHEQGVVHRDIKPANIMIEPGDRVKVADFGIAKVKDASEQQLTATGSLLGTPSYMSPEQARGQTLDGRSDLFSLGCVLYEMLKGRKAFQGDSITSLLFKIIAEEPPPLREDDPEIPPAIEAIVKRALAKSPADRFSSGQEMAAALAAVAAGGSTPTLHTDPRPDVATRALPAPPALPVSADAPTTVGSTPTSATAVRTQSRFPPPPPVPPPPAAPPASQRRIAPAGATAARVPMLVVGVLAAGAFGVLVVAAAGTWWWLGRRPPETVTSAANDPRPVVTPPPAASPTAEETTVATSIPPAPERSEPESQPLPTPGGRRAADAEPMQSTRPYTPPAPPAPRSAAVAPSADTPGAPGFEHLDDEDHASAADGAEAGRRLAESFRSGRGRGTAGGRFTPRARSPQDLRPAERPAAATLRYVILAQEAFARREGRYGSLQELQAAGLLRLDVPIRNGAFQRRGYRFELAAQEEEFQVLAAPLQPGLRPFRGDESGLIREAEQG